jgi:hypothetical protein
MPTFRRNVTPSPSRIGKPSGPPHSITSHKIRILISRLLMFDRKATRTLSSNIDHHIAMCRVLLPGGVASRDSEPVRAAAQHNRRWTQPSSSIQIMLRNPVVAFNIGRKVSRCRGLAVAQDVSLRLVYGLSLRWLEFDPRPGTCDLLWTRVTGTGFFPTTPVLPCHYHSTNAPYSFIHSSI